MKNLDDFEHKINLHLRNKKWSKSDLVTLFCELIPAFKHKEMGKDLDAKM